MASDLFIRAHDQPSWDWPKLTVFSVSSLSDEGYSDDEDTSWKVRRAATKALSAVIAAYPNLLQELYKSSSHALTARFKEREETVKVDAFNVFVELVRQV